MLIQLAKIERLHVLLAFHRLPNKDGATRARRKIVEAMIKGPVWNLPDVIKEAIEAEPDKNVGELYDFELEEDLIEPMITQLKEACVHMVPQMEGPPLPILDATMAMIVDGVIEKLGTCLAIAKAKS